MMNGFEPTRFMTHYGLDFDSLNLATSFKQSNHKILIGNCRWKVELGTISVFPPPKAAFRFSISLVNLLIPPVAALLIPSINITRGNCHSVPVSGLFGGCPCSKREVEPAATAREPRNPRSLHEAILLVDALMLSSIWELHLQVRR